VPEVEGFGDDPLVVVREAVAEGVQGDRGTGEQSHGLRPSRVAGIGIRSGIGAGARHGGGTYSPPA